MAAATFALYRPLEVSGAITHSVACALLDSKSKNIVVIKNNYLEVYQIHEQHAATIAHTAAAAAASSSLTADDPLLMRIFDKQLFGNVEGIWSDRRQANSSAV